MKKNKDYFVSSGNVFADLELPEPQEMLAKAELTYQINTIIQEKGLTQKEAAQLLGVDQPKISALSRGKLQGFALERLFYYLNLLGQDITIKVSPRAKTKKRAGMTVQAPKAKKPNVRKNHTPISSAIPVHAKKRSRAAR